MKSFIILPFIIWIVTCITIWPVQPVDAAPAMHQEYWPPSRCKTCHSAIFDEHSQSFHEKSFSNPVFQGQYYKELLAGAEKDLGLLTEAKACIACHSPINFIELKRPIMSNDQVDPEMSGVTCDFCHTVTGYDGTVPGNGRYIAGPNAERKFGPFLHEYSWHRGYGQFQMKSEFCGICHNSINRFGLEVKSTYTEWKNSSYAEKGIQCQDCHMNLVGFLKEGKSVFESGQAALMPMCDTPYRSILYTHRFPGAHSKTQVFGALNVIMAIETEKTRISSGDLIIISVHVDNSKTGHKMPSGSADLRQLWLELEAYSGDKVVSVPIASTVEGRPYDVVGKGPSDEEILGKDIPKGTRIYRAIFVDKTGKQTLSSYKAERIIFDNRLNPAELRKERYYFRIPDDFKDRIFLRARLIYLPYPTSFARRFGLPNPERFEITSATKELTLH